MLTEWFLRFHAQVQHGAVLTPALLAAICDDAIPHARASTSTSAFAAAPAAGAGPATPAAQSAETRPPSSQPPVSPVSWAPVSWAPLPLEAAPENVSAGDFERVPHALSMRAGFAPLLRDLEEARVPAVVVSAGVGNFILEALRSADILFLRYICIIV